MMRISLLPLMILVMSIFAVIPAHAQTKTDESNVKIRLLPEYGRIEAGQEIWIGIEQSIRKHWHTYWKNPGDSGSAPRIAWDLPAGFELSEIYWPTPHKLPYGPLLNYGYEDNVILLQKLSAPADLPEGALTLNADIEVLVCKEECIPEYGTYTLTLNNPSAEAEDNSAYIAAALGKLPEPVNWDASFAQKDNDFVLTIPVAIGGALDGHDLASLEFFPDDWGLIDNTAAPQSQLTNGTLIIRQKRGDRPLEDLEYTTGVLTIRNADGQTLTAAFQAEKSNAAKTPPTTALSKASTTTFLQALILALLGGIILNLMPCVFPVLSLKALSLAKMSDKEQSHARLHGLSYTAGVMLSFLTIAGILIALQAGGAQIGWGFQLQNPLVVALLAYLLFVIGLNLSGFFEFGSGLANIGGRLTQGHGYSHSFATGILATLVATPCTAPFMAAAIGFALVQPALISLSVFAALGFGLAFPYLLLSFVPAARSILPRPGAWMDVFKQFLAFPMFLSAAWLIWVISQQAGPLGVMVVLFGLVSLSFGLWLLQHMPRKNPGRLIVKTLGAIALLLPFFILPGTAGTQDNSNTAQKTESQKFGETFSPAALEDALKGNDPVFVEMTAAWCITCKANHAIAINIDSTKRVFADNNVRYLIGDWTNQDPEISKYLQSYGRNGVPLYVFYGARDVNTEQRPEPKVLPQILLPDTFANLFETQ